MNKQLRLACTQGDLKKVSEILNDVISMPDDTALIIASQLGHTEIVKFIIDKAPFGINHQDKDGHTALTRALEHLHIETAEVLIKNGANLDLKNENGFTALIYAARYNHIRIAKLLLERNANLDIQSKIGKTALIFASEMCHYDIIELLVNKGANKHLKDIFGDTASTIVNMKHSVIPNLLLKPELLNHQDENGDTLLIEACRYTHEYDVFLLMNKGFDFFIENNKGESAYSILKRNKSLPDKLQSILEKLMLEQDLIDEIDFGRSL